jgi:hypothetical protein
LLTADLVVLAAGGFGTPAILERSGIRCEPTLSVDPVLTIAARVPAAWQCNEIEMPFIVRRDRYILSPYFDWLSFALDPRWRHPPQDIVGVMVKIADEGGGRVDRRGVHTHLTSGDKLRLEEGAALARELLAGADIDPGSTFAGILNGGHPGGTLPLTHATAATLHDERLPENLYVADATLFPRSLGLPPILTIVALASRVARIAASACRPQRNLSGVGPEPAGNWRRRWVSGGSERSYGAAQSTTHSFSQYASRRPSRWKGSPATRAVASASDPASKVISPPDLSPKGPPRQ